MGGKYEDGLDVDREKLKHAFKRRGTTMDAVSAENFFSKNWMGVMARRGHLSKAGVAVLEKYGIEREEVAK